MGIILSALAAAGDAGVQSMNQNIDQQNRLDYLNQQNQYETDRDKNRSMMELQNRKEMIAAELKAKNDNDETLRNTKIANIENAKQGIIERQINKKYGEADKNVDAAANGETDAPLSPEQQAVYDQAKKSDKDRIANSRETYIQAGIDAGYIDPKEVMADSSRQDKQQIMAEIAANRNESAMDRKKMEAENKLELAKMWINAGKNGGAGGSEQTALERNVKMLKDMGYSPEKVESFIFDKKQSSVEDVAGQLLKLDPFAGTSKAMTMDDAVKKAIGIRQQTQNLLNSTPASNPATGSKPGAKLDSMFPKK